MVSVTNIIFLVTFILSISWKSSESFSLDYRNKTLARFRRQTDGHACKGDSSKFQCTTTADCIDEDQECDGKTDCPDGSDEKESLCKTIQCPGYLFKCDYGACISVDQRCDGRKDCNDNSDEVNCNVTNRINTNCRSDQFECNDGECIEIDGKCNGIAECKDTSDETEELCLNIFCPGYTYKCKYGACVDGDAECNAVKNCLDNSDEDEKKCASKPDESTPPPTRYGKKCITPQQPKHGHWVYLSDGRVGSANLRTDSSTVVVFACDQGYKLSSTNDPKHFIVCEETGKWSVTIMPTCEQLCPSQYNSPLITLTCINDGSVLPCDKATDGTILTYKCSPYYEIPLGRPSKSSCYRGSWDHTPECVPVCGEKRVSAEPLIVGGIPVERGHYPWVVAIYSSKDSDPDFTNICGGSLLTTRIVLTAAHCVSKKEGGEKYPAKLYRVAAGKYYNLYEDPRDIDTAQYSQIEDITIHREYKGEFQNFRGDIALLRLKTELKLSKVVQPVCYANLPNLEPNSGGVITGWGYEAAGGDPSEVLKELDLPYNDDDKCLGELDPDFARQYFTTDKMCAGFANKNTSVCKGDSGGGLVFRNHDYRDRFFVHGVVSLGHSYIKNNQIVCNTQASALFTRVGSYLDWIQQTAHRWSMNSVEIR